MTPLELAKTIAATQMLFFSSDFSSNNSFLFKAGIQNKYFEILKYIYFLLYVFIKK